MMERGNSLCINEIMECLSIVSVSLLMDARVGEGGVIPSPLSSTSSPHLWLRGAGGQVEKSAPKQVGLKKDRQISLQQL